MAKPLSKINITSFRNNYNIVRILTDIHDIMKQLKSFNPNNQAVAFATRKKHESDKLDLVLVELKDIKSRLTNVETRLTDIETRLDKHDEMFKVHG